MNAILNRCAFTTRGAGFVYGKQINSDDSPLHNNAVEGLASYNGPPGSIPIINCASMITDEISNRAVLANRIRPGNIRCYWKSIDGNGLRLKNARAIK